MERSPLSRLSPPLVFAALVAACLVLSSGCQGDKVVIIAPDGDRKDGEEADADGSEPAEYAQESAEAEEAPESLIDPDLDPDPETETQEEDPVATCPDVSGCYEVSIATLSVSLHYFYVEAVQDGCDLTLSCMDSTAAPYVFTKSFTVTADGGLLERDQAMGDIPYEWDGQWCWTDDPPFTDYYVALCPMAAELCLDRPCQITF